MNPIWNALLAINARLSQLPASLIALLGRFSMAAVFWLSGQTKIEGLSINLLSGDFQLGWPQLSDTAIFLFQEEYALPFLAPTTAALLAALAEHLLPICLLFGFATRYAALGLLAMTLVIQLFVYPGAYATHGVWATVLLYLVANGAGKLSVDDGLLRLLRR